MAIPALVIAGAKIIASTALAKGTAVGVGSIAGNISAKKAKSLAGCATNNQQNARNWFELVLASPNSDYWQKGFLDSNDMDAMVDITNNAISTIGSNPTWGVGASYTSKYTGTTYNTAPSAAMAPAVDDYIAQKLNKAQAQTVAPSTDEIMTFNDLFGKLSSLYDTSISKVAPVVVSEAQVPGEPQVYQVTTPGETIVSSEPVDYQKFLPYVIIGIVAVFMLLKKGR